MTALFRRLVPAAAALAVLALGACASPLATGDASALVGPEWVLAQAKGQRPVHGSRLTLQFAADGRVSGTGGCNQFTGGWSARGSRLDLSNMAATAMACTDQLVMDQEQAYLKTLGDVRRFAAGDGRLVLRTSEGRELVFLPAG